jgi:hypothetical protein
MVTNTSGTSHRLSRCIDFATRLSALSRTPAAHRSATPAKTITIAIAMSPVVEVRNSSE